MKTLYIYSNKNKRFENDTRIIAREIQIVPYHLSANEKNQLEEWTGLKCSDIVFDSDVDNWSVRTSVFNERIIGKKQLVFLIEDKDEGEKFGYYLNTEVVEKYFPNRGQLKRIETWGGEPFLYMDRIYPLLHSIIKHYPYFDEKNQLHVKTLFEGKLSAIKFLCSLGSSCILISPTELKNEMKEEINKMVENYL